MRIEDADDDSAETACRAVVPFAEWSAEKFIHSLRPSPSRPPRGVLPLQLTLQSLSIGSAMLDGAVADLNRLDVAFGLQHLSLSIPGSSSLPPLLVSTDLCLIFLARFKRS